MNRRGFLGAIAAAPAAALPKFGALSSLTVTVNAAPSPIAASLARLGDGFERLAFQYQHAEYMSARASAALYALTDAFERDGAEA